MYSKIHYMASQKSSICTFKDHIQLRMLCFALILHIQHPTNHHAHIWRRKKSPAAPPPPPTHTPQVTKSLRQVKVWTCWHFKSHDRMFMSEEALEDEWTGKAEIRHAELYSWQQESMQSIQYILTYSRPTRRNLQLISGFSAEGNWPD